MAMYTSHHNQQQQQHPSSAAASRRIPIPTRLPAKSTIPTRSRERDAITSPIISSNEPSQKRYPANSLQPTPTTSSNEPAITAVTVITQALPQKRNILRRKKSLIGAYVSAQKFEQSSFQHSADPHSSNPTPSIKSRNRPSAEHSERPQSRKHQVITPVSNI